MIDIKILRENPECIKKVLHDKAITGVDVEKLQELDGQRLDLQQELDALKAEKNDISADIKSAGKPSESLLEKAKQIKEKIQPLEKKYTQVQTEFYKIFKNVPNIATQDTPVGLSEEENVVVKTWGEKQEFSFSPKNHYEIAAEKDWIDKERAAKVAGARFAYLKGDLVKLQFALINFVMSSLSSEKFIQEVVDRFDLDISTKPFTPILPPYMIKTEPYDAMDRLQPVEDRYKIEGQDLWLQGSAEHVLGSMHANEIFKEQDLPIRYLGYATSFRGEAGTYGKDMEGIIRMHQFDKLEMESFSLAENSHEEHLLFSAIQETFMQKLELPYRKLQKCTFDIGKPNAKGSDIDAWLPGQGQYRETHTADYMTDYQARRLKTKVRRENGNIELVHTNDATAFACGRALVAIIENYQTKEGNVKIPKILIPFMGGVEEI